MYRTLPRLQLSDKCANITSAFLLFGVGVGRCNMGLIECWRRDIERSAHQAQGLNKSLTGILHAKISLHDGVNLVGMVTGSTEHS